LIKPKQRKIARFAADAELFRGFSRLQKEALGPLFGVAKGQRSDFAV
jgi:hypothetical protein